jgi:hypothetical protein
MVDEHQLSERPSFAKSLAGQPLSPPLCVHHLQLFHCNKEVGLHVAGGSLYQGHASLRLFKKSKILFLLNA